MFPYSILSLVLQLALLLVTLSTTSHVVAASASSVSISESSPKISFDGIIQRISKQPPGQQIQSALAQCTPALRTRTIKKRIENSTNNNRYDNSNSNLQALWKDTSIETVSSVKIKANKAKIRIQNLLEYTGSTGFYYGIDPERMIPKNNDGGQRKPRPPKLEDSMAVALEELKQMRLEMERMRIEMQQLKQKMVGDGDEDSSYYKDDQFSAENKAISLRKRRKEAEKLAAEIESWANTMLQEGAEDGWTPVECSKLIRASVNGMERTTAHLKWMADSRAEKADKEDQSKHPCIKCSSTIDAPLELVCAYLSQPNTSVDYNDVVEKHKDLEEISPHAKICWSASPQILFVKPREYITFCHHRWKSDGTQVIVNQACEHPKYPLEKMEKEGKSCRGYALRGANFISRCPEDPSKTEITIVAHCRPGGGLPEWAAKTAVKALAPIEPFKLFHKINEQVIRNKYQLKERVKEAEERGSTLPPGRSSRPGGFAQLGYACFWPNGGGKEERTGISPPTEQPLQDSIDNNQAIGSADDGRENDTEGSVVGEMRQNQQHIDDY